MGHGRGYGETATFLVPILSEKSNEGENETESQEKPQEYKAGTVQEL